MFTKENVISVRFTNNEYTTIEIIHTIKEDEKAHIFVFEYDKDCDEMKQLDKIGWDLERITEETTNYKRAASRSWNNTINAAATEMNKTNIQVDNVVNHILEFNEDEDTIFKSKLAIMELDIVKKSKATKIKQEVRKAKTLIDIIVNLKKFMK